jgi:hypothetical protein
LPLFTGLLNSFDDAWMFNRIEQLGDVNSPYTQKVLGLECTPEIKDDCQKKLESNPQKLMYFNTLYQNLIKSTVDNVYIIRVPFFGVAFDINDLGLLGGLGLFIILTMLRLSLRSYIVSLRIGFKSVFNSELAYNFYDVLASRQVFVFPPLNDEDQDPNEAKSKIEKWWETSSIGKKYKSFRKQENTNLAKGWAVNQYAPLRLVPKVITISPFFVHLCYVITDYQSLETGALINPHRAKLGFMLSLFFLILILMLSVWCISKWNEIDRLWEYYNKKCCK